MKKNIAIVMGGNSAEAIISLKSAEVVRKHLSEDLFNTYKIHISGSNWYFEKDKVQYQIDKNDFSLTIDSVKITFDLVFVAIHGTPGEDGKLQAYFDLINIPYTTSSPFACALSFNKIATNTLLKHHGIISAEFVQLIEGTEIDSEEILAKTGLPCFVKPAEAGSSFGVSKVNSIEELKPAIEEAFKHYHAVMIEEFIEGTEVTCGVMDFDGAPETLPITEIVSETDFFDFEAKYEGKSSEITPARISNEEANLVSETTKKVYTLLDLKGVARADYILKNGVPYLIEANTVPGLSEESLIPQQAIAHGMTLSSLFENWVKRFL